jgi:hypothetical protein
MASCPRGGGTALQQRAHARCSNRVDEAVQPVRPVLGDVLLGLLFPKRRARVAVDHGLVFHHRLKEVASAPALLPAIIGTTNSAALPTFVCIRILAF